MQALTLLGTRLLVACIFLWHGLPKAVYPSMAMAKFVGLGLPGFLGPIIGIVEVIAAICLVLGVLHRQANLLLAVVIVGAIVTVQIPGGITAGLERDLLILAGTLLLSIHGPGILALERRRQQAQLHRPPLTTSDATCAPS
jgi:putative oxidoreductase